MDYKQYSVEDFILDATFRKWVLDPDKDSHMFWRQWLDEHPQKAATVAQAMSYSDKYLGSRIDSASSKHSSSRKR